MQQSCDNILFTFFIIAANQVVLHGENIRIHI